MGVHAGALRYIDDGMIEVEGWFDDTDARAFVAVDRTQLRAQTSGDVLEIGAYLGKSAILLGYFTRPPERLVVADLFGAAPDSDENRHEMEMYESFTLAGFRRNFARFHAWEPVVLCGTSADTLPGLRDGSCRIVHVDGSHNFEAVRADIQQTRRILGRGGVAIFDDMFAAHAPGVQAAVWEAVSEGMVPIAIGSKLYATWTPDAFDRDVFIAELQALEGVVIVGTNRIRGHDVVEFVRDPAWRQPTRTRRALDLLTPPIVPRVTDEVRRRRWRAVRSG
jgi:Methyltransferase domain